eukprot:Trichotokara_eunicae@DN6364_c0_g1_i8.p1
MRLHIAQVFSLVASLSTPVYHYGRTTEKIRLLGSYVEDQVQVYGLKDSNNVMLLTYEGGVWDEKTLGNVNTFDNLENVSMLRGNDTLAFYFQRSGSKVVWVTYTAVGTASFTEPEALHDIITQDSLVLDVDGGFSAQFDGDRVQLVGSYWSLGTMHTRWAEAQEPTIDSKEFQVDDFIDAGPGIATSQVAEQIVQSTGIQGESFIRVFKSQTGGHILLETSLYSEESRVVGSAVVNSEYMYPVKVNGMDDMSMAVDTLQHFVWSPMQLWARPDFVAAMAHLKCGTTAVLDFANPSIPWEGFIHFPSCVGEIRGRKTLAATAIVSGTRPSFVEWEIEFELCQIEIDIKRDQLEISFEDDVFGDVPDIVINHQILAGEQYEIVVFYDNGLLEVHVVGKTVVYKTLGLLPLADISRCVL